MVVGRCNASHDYLGYGGRGTTRGGEVLSYLLEFELEGLPSLQVAGSGGGHWRKRHAEAKRWKQAVRGAVLENFHLPDEPLTRVRMRCERFSTREPDWDNLVASFKPIRDGLVEIGVMVDDKPSVLVACEHRWFKAKRGQGKIRVRLDAVQDTE